MCHRRSHVNRSTPSIGLLIDVSQAHRYDAVLTKKDAVGEGAEDLPQLHSVALSKTPS